MMRFFQADSTSSNAGPAHIGAESLKKPHHIVTLRFSEVVKDHAKYLFFFTMSVMFKDVLY